MNTKMILNVIEDAYNALNKTKTIGNYPFQPFERESVIKDYISLIMQYDLKYPRGYKPALTDNWCAMFISVLFLGNGDQYFPIECSCEEMMNKFWKENALIDPQKEDVCRICSQAKAGDIVFYDWQKNDSWSDHVGIITCVSKYRMRIIEGNKNDKIDLRTIDLHNDYITGVGQIEEYYKSIGKWSD